MRRVVRHETAEIRDIGERDLNFFRELHESGRFPGCPCAEHLPVWIVERGRDRMLAPETRAVRSAVTLVRLLAPGHAPAMGERRRLRKLALCRSEPQSGSRPSPITAPGADHDDQEDGIGPEARRGRIGLRQQVQLDGLEQVGEDRRQL